MKRKLCLFTGFGSSSKIDCIYHNLTAGEWFSSSSPSRGISSMDDWKQKWSSFSIFNNHCYFLATQVFQESVQFFNLVVSTKRSIKITWNTLIQFTLSPQIQSFFFLSFQLHFGSSLFYWVQTFSNENSPNFFRTQLGPFFTFTQNQFQLLLKDHISSNNPNISSKLSFYGIFLTHSILPSNRLATRSMKNMQMGWDWRKKWVALGDTLLHFTSLLFLHKLQISIRTTCCQVWFHFFALSSLHSFISMQIPSQKKKLSSCQITIQEWLSFHLSFSSQIPHHFLISPPSWTSGGIWVNANKKEASNMDEHSHGKEHSKSGSAFGRFTW